MTQNEPLNKTLYNRIKLEANKKFKAPSSIYRSSWIVKEYIRRGGKYSGKKDMYSGLSRWYKEDWVDLNRPTVSGEYESCGRVQASGKYPLCRPTKRITKDTPKTYKEISQKNINKAKREKKSSKHISFGGRYTPGILEYIYRLFFR